MHNLQKKTLPSRAIFLRGLLAGVLAVLFWVLSMPPFEFAEAAYIAFVPLFLWFYIRPKPMVSLLVIFGTGWVAWFIILIWLRHVTLPGTIFLGAILAGIFTIWAFFARWALPQLARLSFGLRLIGFAGIAGVWVVLEWMRCWIFYGFPWAPLSLSQWDRPVVLQVAAWTGAYGVSFMLVFFNLCVAHALWQRVTGGARKVWTYCFSPELYAALALLAFFIAVFFKTLPLTESHERLFSAGIIQPYILPKVKWDEAKEMENFRILEWHTRAVSELKPDLILWPEAATPWPVMGSVPMKVQVENLVHEIGTPLLMGSLAWFPQADEWYNGAFLVDPESGLSKDFYAKRQLVPFGEYIPWPFGFMEKLVPVGGQFLPGKVPGLVDLDVNGHTIPVGPLVCYEDVFPELARQSVQAGAEVLYVATNNAWYGEEGGAVQHAAHSVLRAVENRRPVMRCGNGGWSGWIDAYGRIREVITNEAGRIYFRGGGTYSVSRDREWMCRQSFYTLHGEWFVKVCGGLVVMTLFLFQRCRRKERLA